jgi:hypothetical protein
MFVVTVVSNSFLIPIISNLHLSLNEPSVLFRGYTDIGNDGLHMLVNLVKIWC